jgi:protein farnesyltransferase/geranylgeranyltransferase type-1 subunit alpha
LKTSNIQEKWEDEISFLDELMNDDVRNNSAWNQRWFVAHRGSKSAPFSLAQAESEVQFAIEKAKVDPYNESPWKYFIAIIKEQSRRIGNTEEFPAFLALCEKAIEETKVSFEEASKKDGMECTHLLSAYVDILEIKGGEDCRENALGFMHALETRYDPIRKKYWKLRAEKLQKSS